MAKFSDKIIDSKEFGFTQKDLKDVKRYAFKKDSIDGKKTTQELLGYKYGEVLCQDKKGKKVMTQGFIDGLLLEENIEGIIVKHIGKVIGFLIFRVKGGKGFLDLVCVNKFGKLPGIPIGKLLVRDFERKIMEKGIFILQLEAVKDQEEWYYSLGYRRVKVLKKKQLILMEKKIPFRDRIKN